MTGTEGDGGHRGTDLVSEGSAVDRLLADEDGQRPRADAQRNLKRLVEAARQALAEVGVDVTAHEIAKRAGVGIGTFYRRLPSREALLEAVLDELLEMPIVVADRCLEDPDPWHGLTEFAMTFVRLRTASCGVNEALGGVPKLSIEPSVDKIRDRIRRLVQRAQRAGMMRSDAVWEDVAFLIAGALTETRTIGLEAGSEQWRRNLQIVLDGLHTRETTELPPAEHTRSPHAQELVSSP